MSPWSRGRFCATPDSLRSVDAEVIAQRLVDVIVAQDVEATRASDPSAAQALVRAMIAAFNEVQAATRIIDALVGKVEALRLDVENLQVERDAARDECESLTEMLAAIPGPRPRVDGRDPKNLQTRHLNPGG